jgi:hypothetical protein
MQESERSYERLTEADLRRLRQVTLDKIAMVVQSAPVAGLYRDRLIVLALCQGSAQHQIDGSHGIKDLDVWAFFRAGPQKPFPWRSLWHADFGLSHLGHNPDDVGYLGRRIDIIGRSIPVDANETPLEAVRKWLGGYSKSARLIAERPVIGLYPDMLFNVRIH